MDDYIEISRETQRQTGGTSFRNHKNRHIEFGSSWFPEEGRTKVQANSAVTVIIESVELHSFCELQTRAPSSSSDLRAPSSSSDLK
jgi:hypothetical protein